MKRPVVAAIGFLLGYIVFSAGADVVTHPDMKTQKNQYILIATGTVTHAIQPAMQSVCSLDKKRNVYHQCLDKIGMVEDEYRLMFKIDHFYYLNDEWFSYLLSSKEGISISPDYNTGALRISDKTGKAVVPEQLGKGADAVVFIGGKDLIGKKGLLGSFKSFSLKKDIVDDFAGDLQGVFFEEGEFSYKESIAKLRSKTP